MPLTKVNKRFRKLYRFDNIDEIKAAVIFFDILHSIVIQVLRFRGKETNLNKILTISIVGAAYAIVSFIIFVAKVYCDYRQHKEEQNGTPPPPQNNIQQQNGDIQQQDDTSSNTRCKTCGTKTCTCSGNCCEKLHEWCKKPYTGLGLTTVLDTILLVSTWAYFVGDNLQTDKEYIRIILLGFAIFAFCAVPAYKKVIKKLTKRDEDKKKKQTDIIKTTFINTFYALMIVLGIVPGIDAVYTQLITIDELKSSTCVTANTNTLWGIYGAFVLLGVTVAIVKGTYAMFKKTWKILFSKSESELNDMDKYCCICTLITIDTLIILFTIVMLALFLVADNAQPLDCQVMDKRTSAKIRIGFLVVSMFLYLLLMGSGFASCALVHRLD